MHAVTHNIKYMHIAYIFISVIAFSFSNSAHNVHIAYLHLVIALAISYSSSSQQSLVNGFRYQVSLHTSYEYFKGSNLY